MCSIRNSFPHCPATPGSVLPPPWGFARFASDLCTCQVEPPRHRKEGYDCDQCPWMAMLTQKKKRGGLGFVGRGRSRQMRVAIFERACRGPSPLPPTSSLSILLSGKRISCLEYTPFPRSWSSPLLKHSDWPIEAFAALANGGSPNSTLASVRDKFPIGLYRQ